MPKYRMTAWDIDANPIQYVAWIHSEPDLSGDFYDGLKAGDHPLQNISVYFIEDDFAVVDFNLPDPLTWKESQHVLPGSLDGSQLAILDGYVYLFGGRNSPAIYRAPLNNPCDWSYDGYNLPSSLYGSQLSIVDDKIYLFGGDIGGSANHIYSANTSNPFVWTDHGAILPTHLLWSQLWTIDGYMYLYGGHNLLFGDDVILSASTNDPLTWFDTGNNLPEKLYKSNVAEIDGYVYMFGGNLSTQTLSNNIYRAPISEPTNFGLAGALPYGVSCGQFFIIGDKCWMVTNGNTVSSQKSNGARILRAPKGNPLEWVDMLKNVPGEVFESQFAIIMDRCYLFGGNGNSSIFSCDVKLKYDVNSETVLTYGNVTRTLYNLTSINELSSLLGFQYWKANY